MLYDLLSNSVGNLASRRVIKRKGIQHLISIQVIESRYHICFTRSLIFILLLDL